MLQCREVAEATTAKGREIISLTKECIEKNFDQAPGCTVIYGDTDSAFVRLPSKLRDAPEELIYKFGNDMAAFVTKHIRDSLPRDLHPFCRVKLEMEKYLCPSIFYKKKRYVGKSFEDLGKEGKMLIKGLELVRRDAVPLVKKVQADIVDALLNRADPLQAIALTKEAIDKIISTPCGGPFNELVLSKSLRSEYKNPEGMAHRAVADRMDRRIAGSAPRVGDRVEYVVIASQSARVVDRSEDVAYAEAKKLPPDWHFYLESLERPVMRLLEVPLRSEHFAEKKLYEELVEYMQVEKTKAFKKRQRFSRVCKSDGSWIEGIKCKDGQGLQPTVLTCLTKNTLSKDDIKVDEFEKEAVSDTLTITFPAHSEFSNSQEGIKKTRSKKRSAISNDALSKNQRTLFSYETKEE